MVRSGPRAETRGQRSKWPHPFLRWRAGSSSGTRRDASHRGQEPTASVRGGDAGWPSRHSTTISTCSGDAGIVGRRRSSTGDWKVSLARERTRRLLLRRSPTTFTRWSRSIASARYPVAVSRSAGRVPVCVSAAGGFRGGRSPWITHGTTGGGMRLPERGPLRDRRRVERAVSGNLSLRFWPATGPAGRRGTNA